MEGQSVQIPLTHQEAALLGEVLQHYLGNLRMEVSQTDNYDVRARLKREEEVIKDLLARLQQGARQQTH